MGARRLKASVVTAVAVAVLPWVSLGFLTPVAFTIAATARRSRLLGLAAVGYLGAVAGMFMLAESESVWFGACIVVAMFGGGVHAIAVAPLVARGARTRQAEDPLVTLVDAVRDDIGTDPVLTAVVERRERRRLARQIVATDPALADDLAIGQPGRDVRFDDGGLIDVNRVDAAVLATLPGLDNGVAARIVAARQRFEGLRSTADLVVHAGVPPEVADQLADRLLFRPLDDQVGDQVQSTSD